MTSKEYLAGYPDRVNALVERLKKAVDGLTDEQFNTKQEDGWWSIGQIIEHLMIANGPYLVEMAHVAKSAPRSGGTDEIKHTWFGRFLINAMDKPNIPAHRSMHPGPGPMEKSKVDDWAAQYSELVSIAKNSDGINLTEAKIRNPFVKLAKMNVADMFEIIAAHTERHVKQIEELALRFA
ncbi:MAG: DinB family protein [Fimbriimonadaceae bacterium]|nr:DinB family protein [Fimbriimonadaceae bacterium]